MAQLSTVQTHIITFVDSGYNNRKYYIICKDKIEAWNIQSNLLQQNEKLGYNRFRYIRFRINIPKDKNFNNLTNSF